MFVYLMLVGWLVCEGISPSAVGDWVSEISAWEKSDDKWLLHWEAVGEDEVRTLCRAENFVNFHPGNTIFLTLQFNCTFTYSLHTFTSFTSLTLSLTFSFTSLTLTLSLTSFVTRS